MVSKNIIENSPFKLKRASQTHNPFEEEDNELADEEVSEEILNSFLEIKANFEGKNLSQEIKRFVLFCRCLLSKPQVLLTFEESLQFGRGVEYNLEAIAKHLPHSTLITVTKGHANLLAYDTLIFLDSGKVIERGTPTQLLKNEQSYLHRFLRETDEEGLEYLANKLQDIEAERDLRELDKPRKESLSAFSAGKFPEMQLAGDKNFSFNMQKCDLFTVEHKAELLRQSGSSHKFKRSDYFDSFESRSKRSSLFEQPPRKNSQLRPLAAAESLGEPAAAEERNAVRVSSYKSSIMKRPSSHVVFKQAQR